MTEPVPEDNTSAEGSADSSAGRVEVGDGSCRINRQTRQARWMGWSASGSLVLHAVMFYIMTLPVLQVTAVSLAPNPDFFWLTPFFLPGDKGSVQQQVEESPAEPAPAKESFDKQSEKHAAAQLPEVPEIENTAGPDDFNPTEPAEAELVVVRPAVLNKQPASVYARPRTATVPPVAVKPDQPSMAPKTAKQAAVTTRSEQTEAPAEIPMAPHKEKPLVAQGAARQEEAAIWARHQTEQLAKEQAEQVRRNQEQQKLAMEAEKAVQEKAARQSAELEAARHQAQLRQLAAQAADKAEKDRTARQQAEELARKQELQKQQAAAEQARLAQDKAEHERKAVEKVRQENLAREQAEHERLTAVQRERHKTVSIGGGAPVVKPDTVKQAIVQVKSASGQSDKQVSSKPEKAKGLAIPTVPGDLKLVISGSAPRNVRIAFKEFGLKRRNRPFTKAEAKNDIKVTPVVIFTQEKVREYVVAKVNDGVYSITLELDDLSGDSRFAVMLYDGSVRKQRKVLDAVSTRNKRVKVKVLMPDGIFWDDDGAFTGTMEDSDSVTKFNAETGLVWKEFNVE